MAADDAGLQEATPLPEGPPAETPIESDQASAHPTTGGAVDLRIRLTAMDSAHDMIVIVNRDGAIHYVNPSFSCGTGYAREEVIGQNPRILKSGEHDAAFYKNLWETILSGNVWQGTMINRRKDGSLYHERQTITPILAPDSEEITHFVAIKQVLTD